MSGAGLWLCQLEADIWFASSIGAGADTVTATLSGGGGMRTILMVLMVAAVRGPVAADGGAAAASSGKRFLTDLKTARSGDLLISVFVAAGSDAGTADGDGTAQLGAVCLPSIGLQSDQNYGRGASDLFTTEFSATGAVAVATLGV